MDFGVLCSENRETPPITLTHVSMVRQVRAPTEYRDDSSDNDSFYSAKTDLSSDDDDVASLPPVPFELGNRTSSSRRLSIFCTVDLTEGPSVVIDLSSDDDNEYNDDDHNLLPIEDTSETEDSPIINVRSVRKPFVISDGESDGEIEVVRRKITFENEVIEIKSSSDEANNNDDGNNDSSDSNDDSDDDSIGPLVRRTQQKLKIVDSDESDDNKENHISIQTDNSAIYSPAAISTEHQLTLLKTPSRNIIVHTPVASKPPRTVYRSAKSSFKQPKPHFDREKESDRMYTEYNQRVFDGQLDFVKLHWNKRLNKTAGQAKHTNGQYSIELSWKVVDDLDRLKNTLAHEMCHIAVWFYHGFNHPPHGKIFMSFGMRFKMFYEELTVSRSHTYEINYKFQYLCQKCGHAYGRHSRSIDVERFRCGNGCGGLLKLQKNI